MTKSKKPGTFEPGHTINKKEGVEKKMRIRFADQSQIEFVEEWLKDPTARGKALMRMAEMACSDDLIKKTTHYELRRNKMKGPYKLYDGQGIEAPPNEWVLDGFTREEALEYIEKYPSGAGRYYFEGEGEYITWPKDEAKQEKKMKNVILSTELIIGEGFFSNKKITIDEAKRLLGEGQWENYHGHETVRILGIEPAKTRENCKRYDRAIAVNSKERLEYGREYTLEEIEKIGVEIALIENVTGAVHNWLNMYPDLRWEGYW